MNLNESDKKKIKGFIIWLIAAVILIVQPLDDAVEIAIGLVPPFNYTDELVAVIMAISKGIEAFALIYTFNGLHKAADTGIDKLKEIDPEAGEIAEKITDVGISMAEATIAQKSGILGGSVADDAAKAESALAQVESKASIIADSQVARETVAKSANNLASKVTKNMDIF